MAIESSRVVDNQFMKQTRNQWIDVAKGITIILMVLGHSSLPKPISNYIWSFHMPLFFIASGWMTNWDKYGMQFFFIRKFQTLIIPFCVYSLIVLVWRYLLTGEGLFSWLGNGWDGYALWFIPVLFLALIIAKAISMVVYKSLRFTIIVGLLALGCALCYNGIILPWTLSTVPYAVFLVLAGSLLRRFQQEVEQPRWWVALLCAIVTIITSQMWRLDLCCNQILPLLPLTIAAFAGTMMVFMLSSYITNYSIPVSKVLQEVGKETYIVVAFSQIIIMTINQYITHSVLVKYSMLIVLLVTIKYAKNVITQITKRQ